MGQSSNVEVTVNVNIDKQSAVDVAVQVLKNAEVIKNLGADKVAEILKSFVEKKSPV